MKESFEPYRRKRENWEIGTNQSAVCRATTLNLQKCETEDLIGLFKRNFVVQKNNKKNSKEIPTGPA